MRPLAECSRRIYYLISLVILSGRSFDFVPIRIGTLLRMTGKNSKIENFILDTLFPISCLSCGTPDIWVCPDCLGKIKLLPDQVCPYCEKNVTDAGRICPACKNKFLSKNATAPLDGLIIASSYRENNISRLVHLHSGGGKGVHPNIWLNRKEIAKPPTEPN